MTITGFPTLASGLTLCYVCLVFLWGGSRVTPHVLGGVVIVAVQLWIMWSNLHPISGSVAVVWFIAWFAYAVSADFIWLMVKGWRMASTSNSTRFKLLVWAVLWFLFVWLFDTGLEHTLCEVWSCTL